ncbi:Hypothetical predicted protein [Marmota monax]|uniref:Uncharacterized protein n=1 Tax=Marmota monax TaxID=9995 RepID=A0A5E4BAQ9_MARMO|nr:Hypothetical predicted protein [Marmota monax]
MSDVTKVLVQRKGLIYFKGRPVPTRVYGHIEIPKCVTDLIRVPRFPGYSLIRPDHLRVDRHPTPKVWTQGRKEEVQRGNKPWYMLRQKNNRSPYRPRARRRPPPTHRPRRHRSVQPLRGQGPKTP